MSERKKIGVDWTPEYLAYKRVLDQLGTDPEHVRDFIAKGYYLVIAYKEGRTRKTVYAKLESIDHFRMKVLIHPGDTPHTFSFNSDSISRISKKQALTKADETAAGKAASKMEAEGADSEALDETQAEGTQAREEARLKKQKMNTRIKKLLAGSRAQRTLGNVIRSLTEEDWEYIAREKAFEDERRAREREAEARYYANDNEKKLHRAA